MVKFGKEDLREVEIVDVDLAHKLASVNTENGELFTCTWESISKLNVSEDVITSLLNGGDIMDNIDRLVEQEVVESI